MKHGLLLLAAALAAACTTKPVPGVCCIGPEDCSQLGLTEDRPCLQGEACVDFHCVSASCTTLGCPAETPVCDGDACRGCRLDTECPSGACGDDGACVEEAAALYLSPSGLNRGACTRGAPCITLTFATTQSSENRNHIVMANGTYVGMNAITSGITSASNIHIHGHGATLTSGPGDEGIFFYFNLEGSVRDLNFVGAGIARDVSVLGTPVIAEGLAFSGAQLTLGGNTTLRDFSISDSQTDGIYVLGATTMERGVIRNGARGIVNDASGFPVLNIENVLVSGTSGRALDIGNSSGRIRFVTIADVGSQQGTGSHAVECGPGLSVESSIIWAPTGFGQPPLSGGCKLVATIAGPTAIPGAANTDPFFVDPDTGDYHLKPSSPARDMVDSGPATDFEGDPRPRGARFDIGADEAP